MKSKSDILERINGNDGMSVPEGFFENFSDRMMASLPEREEIESSHRAAPRKSIWGTVRPYIYMAAMFAGIWCMLKMFTLMSSQNIDFSIDRNHILTEALSDDEFVYDYLYDDINEREMWEDCYGDSISVSEFMVEEFPEDDSIMVESSADNPFI